MKQLLSMVGVTALICGLFARAADQAMAPNTEILAGTWKVTAMIDDGQSLTPQEISTHFVSNGLLTVDGNTIQFTPTNGYETRKVIFMLPKVAPGEPKSIDIVGTEKLGSKGIFMLNDDHLLLCIGVGPKASRPTAFASDKDSGNLLIAFRREAKSKGDSATPTSNFKPIPKPEAPEVPPAPPVPTLQPPVPTAKGMRELVVGRWGHQDDDSITYMTFNQDGSFSSTQDWKKKVRNLFHESVKSSGTWKLEDGMIVVTITTSTDRDRRGQVYSYRVVKVTEEELVSTDYAGRIRREWKVR